MKATKASPNNHSTPRTMSTAAAATTRRKTSAGERSTG